MEKSTKAVTLYWPTDSTNITQSFGNNGHEGTDIGGLTPGVEGDNVYAYMDGYVSKITTPTSNPSEGYSVRIHHASDPLYYSGHDRIRTQYMHLRGKPTVSAGDYVTAGEVIGYMGQSGNADGVHLHFEVRGGTSSQFPIPGSSAYNVGSVMNSDTYLDLI